MLGKFRAQKKGRCQPLLAFACHMEDTICLDLPRESPLAARVRSSLRLGLATGRLETSRDSSETSPL